VRRILCLAAGALAVIGLGAALAAATTPRAKLQLRHTSVGTILVNSRGFTLYAFTPDGRNRDTCQNRPYCLSIWPADKTSGKAIAGPGVKASLIGTITLKNGAKQVTYNGHPLYTYAEDTHPGQTSYVNILQFGGYWPAVNAKGNDVK
jgi:predicted lipoprotein with Yx(FWY)xxD motif